MKRYHFFFVVLAFSLTTLSLAQSGIPLLNPSIQGLYHVESVDELQSRDAMQLLFTPTPPPGGVVTNIAEFNRMQGVLITFRSGFGIPYNLIAEMAEDVTLYTIVTGAAQENTVRTLYQNAGVNLSNCQFVYAPSDSYWTRDYGPWFIKSDSGYVAIVDFPYNRPRPNDNNVPVVMSSYLGIPLFGMNLIHTGGNYMTDGMGISASTTLVQTENPTLSLTQIQQYVQNYLGVHTYHLNVDPLGQYIEHIDCWGKFLDVDKILIGEVPPSHPRYLNYEAVVSYYATSISSYGTPYQVFRVYSPDGQPYTNSLILNNKVLVPIVSSASAAVWNAPALAVYQQAMPGYEVLGFMQASNAPWQSTDALHCRTKGVADIRLLDIRHLPLSGNVPAQNGFEIRARIQAYADSGLVMDSVRLVYRVNGGNWSSLQMVQDTARDFVAMIPAQGNGSEVDYYVSAKDSTGRKETHPFIGGFDPHSFTITGYTGLDGSSRNELKISVYPNPATDYTFLRFHLSTVSDASLVVMDMGGRIVRETKLHSMTPGEQFWKLDLKGIEKGSYVINIISNLGKQTAKLVVL